MPLAILVGCATSPTPLSEEARAKIGRISVTAVQAAPKTKLSVPYTRGEGAAAGALMGSGVGLVAGMGTGMNELSHDGGAPVLATAAVAAVAIPIGAVVGGVAGGASGTPRKETVAGEQALRQFCAAVDFQECVRREVAAEIRKNTRHPVAKGGTDGNPPADSILEINVLEVGLDGSRSKNSRLELFLRVQARLLSWPDGAVLYKSKALRWSSMIYGLGPDRTVAVFTFNEWAGRGGLLFQKYLGIGCREMAEIIVREIFPGEAQPVANRSAPRLADRPQTTQRNSMWHRHG